MKFESKNKANKVTLDTIKEGELFKHGNKIFIKMQSVTGFLTSDTEEDEWEYNAVDIENGEVHCLYDFMEVEKVKYTLTIDD